MACTQLGDAQQAGLYRKIPGTAGHEGAAASTGTEDPGRYTPPSGNGGGDSSGYSARISYARRSPASRNALAPGWRTGPGRRRMAAPLAGLYEQQGRISESLAALAGAASGCPIGSRRVSIAAAYQRMERFEDAEKTYRKMMELAPASQQLRGAGPVLPPDRPEVRGGPVACPESRGAGAGSRRTGSCWPKPVCGTATARPPGPRSNVRWHSTRAMPSTSDSTTDCGSDIRLRSPVRSAGGCPSRSPGNSPRWLPPDDHPSAERRPTAKASRPGCFCSRTCRRRRIRSLATACESTDRRVRGSVPAKMTPDPVPSPPGYFSIRVRPKAVRTRTSARTRFPPG